MANSITNTYSKLRLSGMVSGLDTDAIIKQLVNLEKSKVDKVKQDRQLLEWKRDSYREATNLLRSFKDSYFDVLKPETNFRSATAFTGYDVTSGDSSVVSAKAMAGAASASHSITVRKLATGSKLEKSAADFHVTGSVAGSIGISDFNLSGKQIQLNFDGVSRTIALDNYTGATNSEKLTDLEAKLQTNINKAIGSGKLDVVVNGSNIEFKTLVNGSTFSLSEASGGNGLEKLGFASNDNLSNRISLSSSLASIKGHFYTALDFNSNENVSFEINGVTINLDKKFSEATIEDVMSAVNKSSANVELKYNSLRDKFTLASKQTGAAETITITDTKASNGLLKALGIEAADLVQGEDAEFDLDGVTGMKRGSNEFTIDGMTYMLKGVSDPARPVTVSAQANADKLVDRIKDFVGKYNEMIDKLNTIYSDKRDKSYLPLTDDQKESLSEDEIKKWEEKARTGLLKGDSIVGNILSNMRTALYSTVEGTDISLFSIGIKTGTYEQKGKLVIDETKLKEAITNNIDEVTKLFTKNSDISYEEALTDSGKRKTRYNESGLGQRLFDILQDNIRTIRDPDGKKGALLEKAGIKGDLSEFKNSINEEISKKSTLIDTLLDKLEDKEASLYKRFAAMETALSNMNSQSAWLAQQFGTSQ